MFTAGVGENDPLTRKLVCQDMDFFGIMLDEDKNLKREPGIREINTAAARTKVLVIPTNEELMIATDTARLVWHRASNIGG